jgi:hypothetical protein
MTVPVQDDRRLNTLRWLTQLSIGLIVVGCAVAVAVPAGHRWDFANFYDAGRRVAAGRIQDLYLPGSPIDGGPPQGVMAFWGTPISAALYVPLGWFPPAAALVLFKIQNVAAYAVSLVLLFVFYRRFVPDSPLARARFGALFAFLCLIYQPFWTVFRVGGQTTPTVLLLFVLALVWHTQSRFWASAFCIVLATILKPALAPALALLLVISGLPFFINAAVWLAAAGVVSVLTMGWPVHAAFLSLMTGGVRDTFPWQFNSSLYVLIEHLRLALGTRGDTGFLRMLLMALPSGLKLVLLATFAYLFLQSRRQRWPEAAQRHFHVLLAILFFILWSRTLWDHYLALLFVPLIYVVATRPYFSRGAMALIAGIFLLSIGQNLVLTEILHARLRLESPGALIAIALFKTGPLVLTLTLLWRHGHGLLRSHTAPAWEHDPVAAATRT